MDLTGKAILVTGATGELGRAVSRAVAAAGARVYATWIVPGDGPQAEQLAVGGRAIEADVTTEVGAAAAVSAVLESAGRIDGLANIVGGYDGGTPLVDLAVARWEHMMSLNLRSAMLMCRTALRPMLAAGAGRIVNVASRAAVRPAAGQAAYNVAKAGVVTLTESLAEETVGTGVTCNAIMPSTIDTAANRRAMPGADFTRWPRPEAIAPVVVFLLSDASAVVNGAVVPVFGDDR